MEPIGFSIGETARMFHDTIRKKVIKSGISETWFHIMGILDHNDKITQKRIAEHMHMKPSSISVALGNMEEEGLILRERSESDSRVVYVSLTEKGKRKSAELEGFFKETDKLIEDSVTKEEFENFRSCLFKMREAMKNA